MQAVHPKDGAILERSGAALFPADAQDERCAPPYMGRAAAIGPRRQDRRPDMYRQTFLSIAATLLTLSLFSGTAAIVTAGTPIAAESVAA